jgi:hypothetical protein
MDGGGVSNRPDVQSASVVAKLIASIAKLVFSSKLVSVA